MIENMGTTERKQHMDVQQIEDLGKILFGGSDRAIRKLKRLPVSPWPVVGFDTEYTSNGRIKRTKAGDCRLPTLLSFQLHTGEQGGFYEIKSGDDFNPARLYQECCALLGKAHKDIYLAVYFSLAELQFLPVFTEGFHLMEYSRGSTDCSFKAGNGNLHIFDLCRWFDGQGLAKAALALGYEKKAQATWKMTRSLNNTVKGREYALHDAWLCQQIAKDLRLVFLSKTGVDPLMTKTPASASAKAFRALHVKSDIFCDEDRARRLSLLGLWGGRAEVFARGKLDGDYAEYDFTSAYPTAANLIREFPEQGSWREFRTLKQVKTMKGGFCHVRFIFDHEERYPCLPTRIDGYTIYPIRGESFCTIYEARLAQEMGADVKVLDGWGYRKGTKVLSDYLEWTMEERKGAKGAARQMWKLLGNALVGKLAQRGVYCDHERLAELAVDMGYTDLAELANDLRELNREEKQALGIMRPSVGPVFLPEWNGLITGYVRAKLSKVLRQMEAVYCHTDSVWVKVPSGKFNYEDEISPFKRTMHYDIPLELKGTGPCTIVRSRFGMIGPHTAAAVKDSRTHLAFHSIWSRDAALEIVQDFAKSPGTWNYEYERRRPLHWKEAAKLGVPPGTWITQSRIGSTYWDCKRRLLASGETVPWLTASQFSVAHKRLEASKRAAGEYVELDLDD